jgi:hypothetical protein
LQRLTFIYLAACLLVGGFSLLVVPELTLLLLCRTAATVM